MGLEKKQIGNLRAVKPSLEIALELIKGAEAAAKRHLIEISRYS